MTELPSNKLNFNLEIFTMLQTLMKRTPFSDSIPDQLTKEEKDQKEEPEEEEEEIEGEEAER